MSLKTKLIKEFGADKAKQMLSDHGKEMSARVKNRYNAFANPEIQAKAQQRRAEKRAEHNKAVEGLTSEDFTIKGKKAS